MIKKLFFTLLTSAMLFSQKNADTKMNIVKTNVTAYAFKNINITYERILNKNFSVAVGLGNIPSGTLAYSDAFTDGTDFQNIKVGMTNFTIEPRYYVGAGYGHGFYLAPYYRYTSVSADDLKYTTTLSNNEEISVDLSGKVSANSGGLMIGAQWFLGESNNWVLDFWMLGAHYGAASGDVSGKTSRKLTADEQQELREDLQDLDIPFVKYKASVNEDGAKLHVDGPWAGVRFGLSFGYRF